MIRRCRWRSGLRDYLGSGLKKCLKTEGRHETDEREEAEGCGDVGRPGGDERDRAAGVAATYVAALGVDGAGGDADGAGDRVDGAPASK